VSLIAHTTTTHGLKIHARLDRSHYPTGIKVTKDEWAAINLKPDEFHGTWNYTIAPTGVRN
jgi:Rhodopirellula transposase DDE domain